MPPFPQAPPTVSGNLLTVDRYLRAPLEIARDLSDLALQRFFAEELFNEGPDAPAGAVVYDELTANDIYPARDVARHTPGGQFPLVITTRPTPKTAYAEEYGGKFYLTYSAIRRNAINDFDRDERLLANAIVRKWNNIAIDLLNATVTAVGASAIVTGADWGTSTTDIWANLAAGQFAADQREMGIVLDTVIVNPAQALDAMSSDKFRNLLTPETRQALVQQPDLMPSQNPAGLTFRKSYRQPAGTALVVARGLIGGRHREAPAGDEGDNVAYDDASGIAVQTWDDPENTRRWVQGWKSEVLYVNNPYAVYRIEGI